MMRPLSPIEFELLRTQPLKDWTSFRDIVWAFNGPREATYQMAYIRQALANLCKRRILESKASGDDVRLPNVRDGGRLYRRRAQTKKPAKAGLS